MGRIAYTITSGELPMTILLKEGETTIATNVHTEYGSYSFEDIPASDYVIEFYELSTYLCGSETIIQCTTCPEGYTPIGDKCIFYDEQPPTYTDPTYTILRKTGYTGYGYSGTVLFDTWNSDGTGTYQRLLTPYWMNLIPNSTDGPMNRTCVWANVTLPDQDIGFSFCIDIAVSKTYYVGFGCDNLGKVKVNGEYVLIQNIANLRNMFLTNGDPIGYGDYNRITFNYWYIYPILLEEGRNVIEIIGHNVASIAAVGVQIYNATEQDFIDATTLNPLGSKILFSSETLDGQTLNYEYSLSGGYHGYSCPDGYALDTCDGIPVCVERIVINCGELPPTTTTTTSSSSTTTTTTSSTSTTTTTTSSSSTTTTTTTICQIDVYLVDVECETTTTTTTEQEQTTTTTTTEVLSDMIIAAIPNRTSPQLFYSTDEGQNWAAGNAVTSVNYTSPRLLKVAHGDKNKMLFIVNSASTDNAGFYSTDKGLTFTALTETQSYMYGSGISSDGTVMITSRSHDTEEIQFSLNSGSSWTEHTAAVIAMNKPRGICVNSDGSEIYFHNNSTLAVGVGRKTTNFFASYVTFTAPSSIIFDACCSNDCNYIYASPESVSTNTSIIYKTTDKYISYGSKTVHSDSGSWNNLGIDCSGNGQYLLNVCYSTTPSNHGRIYVSNDYGESWTRKTTNITESELYGSYVLSVSDSGKYMVVASATVNGKYYYSTNYGVDWNSTTIPSFGAYLITAIAVQD